MLVQDVSALVKHEPVFIFQNGVSLYFVEEAVYEEFLVADDHTKRLALAVVVLDLINHRVIKSRIIV